MAETNIANRDPMSRAAARQLLLIAGGAVIGLAALLAALGWAATLTGGGAAQSQGLDFESRTVTLSLRNELPNLDSTRSKDVESYNILHTVMEGLLRYDVNANLEPGVAERWELDGTRATRTRSRGPWTPQRLRSTRSCCTPSRTARRSTAARCRPNRSACAPPAIALLLVELKRRNRRRVAGASR